MENDAPVDLVGLRAVVADDDGMIQLQFSKLLSQAGILVIGTARTGQDAVALVLRERPELVTMDVRMPTMDGLEAARRIMESYQPCIIMVSALGDEHYQDEGRRIGVGGYVVKPVGRNTLIKQIREAYGTFLHRRRVDAADTDESSPS